MAKSDLEQLGESRVSESSVSDLHNLQKIGFWEKVERKLGLLEKG